MKKALYLAVVLLTAYMACKKQNDVESSIRKDANSSLSQISYLGRVKASLRDSLSQTDFARLDFDKVLRSTDVRSKNYFLRIAFIDKAIANDFLILKTDSTGNVFTGRIVHVRKTLLQKFRSNITDVTFSVSSLDRRTIAFVGTKGEKPRSSMAPPSQQEPMPTLPDCVVVGYTYGDGNGYSWYSFDALVGGSTVPGGGTYTYGDSDPQLHGGGAIHEDKTIDISFESTSEPGIDVSKYLRCFSNLPDQGASFRITILTDLPVNGDPNQLFDFKTGACGHSFIQLYKSNGGISVQQTIGFYPESGWKSIEANGPVTSKIVDNAGHEFNASLTVDIDAAHFQNAINTILYQSKAKYDIDNNNCTDFALNVFNVAAPTLTIPEYHIPGGMDGELSNTPQGLFNELVSLNESKQYPDGKIEIPGAAGYIGSSDGPCE